MGRRQLGRAAEGSWWHTWRLEAGAGASACFAFLITVRLLLLAISAIGVSSSYHGNASVPLGWALITLDWAIEGLWARVWGG